MAEAVKDVRARLTIEKDGEPEAFRQTADAIDVLADSSADLGSVAQTAIRNFSEAMREAANARDVESQRAALERATAALREYGKEAESSGHASELALSQLRSTIESLERETARLAEPLEAEFAAATAAVERFGQRVETGSHGYVRAFAAAKVAVAQLEDQIRQLEGTGVNTGPLEQRLASLKSEMDQNSIAAGRFRAAMQDADDELRQTTLDAGEAEKQIGSLEDIVNTFNPELGQTVAKLLALQAALAIVQAVGRDAAEALEDTALAIGFTKAEAEDLARLVETSFSLNPLEVISDRIKRSAEGAKQSFEILQLAIEGYRNDVEALRAGPPLDLGEAQAAARAREFARAVLDVRDAVELRTQQIIQGIEVIRRDGEITAGAQRQIVAAIDAQIEALSRIGKSSPELEQLRREIAALTFGVEDFSTKIGLSIQQLDNQAIALATNAKAFAAANAQLTKNDLSKIFHDQIQKILDSFEQLNLKPPKYLQDLADKWGIVSSSAEQAAKRIKAAADEIQAAVTGAAAKTSEQLGESAAALEKALGGLSERINTLSFDQFTAAREEIQKVIDEFTAAGEKIPASLVQIATRFGIFQNQAGLATKSAKDLAGGTAAIGISADAARPSIENLKKPTEDLKGALDGAGAKASEAGLGLAETAKAAGEAAAPDKVPAAAKAIQDTATATDNVSSAAAGFTLGPVVGEVDALAKALATVGTAIQNELIKALQNVGTGSSGWSAPIIAELDAIIAKAAQTKAALNEVVS